MDALGKLRTPDDIAARILSDLFGARVVEEDYRCYQEFRDELDQPMDLPRMLKGMERLRGARLDHACV